MTEAKYTPGPWYLISMDNKFELYGSSAEYIADIKDWSDEDIEGQQEAHSNACLMASAPKLLEALEAIYGDYDQWYRKQGNNISCKLCDSISHEYEDDVSHDKNCPVFLAEQAIAKAKGVASGT